MRFRIRQVILWPRNSQFRARTLDFSKVEGRENRGIVQVIRGTSGTGKSALLHIIEYCFGSKASSIPVDPEFQTVGWYGLVLHARGQQVLVARKAVGIKRGEDEEYHFSYTQIVDLKAPPIGRIDRSAFVRMWDEFLDLEIEDDDREHDDARQLRPFIHDMTPILLAPSNYLGAPTGLLQTGASTLERVKRLMPLSLQATTASLIRLQEKDKKERRELRSIKGRSDTRSESLATTERAVVREYQTAVRFGLIPASASTANSTELLDGLLQLAKRFAPDEAGDSVSAGWRAWVKRKDAIEARERRLRREQSGINRQLTQIDQLSREVGTAKRRNNALDWFREHVHGSSPCPVCGSDSVAAHDVLQSVRNSVDGLEKEQVTIQIWSTDLAARANDLRVRLDQLSALLSEVIRERAIIESAIGESRDGIDSPTFRELDRLIGAIESLIDAKPQLEKLEQERAKSRELEAHLSTIKIQLSAENFEELFDSLEGQLILHLQYYAQTMGLDHTEYDMSLPLRSFILSLKMPNARGRLTSRRIEDLGSGKSAMGYKIAAHLALHEMFALFDESPIPSLFVVDQPSAVDSSPPDANGKTLVTRVFEALTHLAQMTRTQIIVLEGMTEHDFLFLDEVSIVEEWPTQEQGLIPLEWLTDEA